MGCGRDGIRSENASNGVVHHGDAPRDTLVQQVSDVRSGSRVARELKHTECASAK